MRILTLTSSYPKFPGDTTAPFIEAITRELAGRGHSLTVVLPHRADLAPEALPGVRFAPFRYAPHASLELFGYAEALRADVTVRRATYGIAPLAVLAGARALRAELRARDYDVVHAHWVVPGGAIASLGLGGEGLPLVVSVHGSDVFLSEKKRAFRLFARRAFERSAAATACSEDLAKRSLALGARERPEVIPYGVDTERFRPEVAGARELRERLAPEGEALALGVGRLVHKKGFEVLLDAAAELHRRGGRLSVAIAGRGDLRGELEERARVRGILDRVRFLGNVERDELPRLFAAADLVVVPSVRDAAGNVDGLPNVLLEAMASGRAIAATEVGGIPQAVRAGSEALLVPEKDARGLAAALEALVSSAELRGKLGEAARRRARECFSWARAGARYEHVLCTVAEARCP